MGQQVLGTIHTGGIYLIVAGAALLVVYYYHGVRRLRLFGKDRFTAFAIGVISGGIVVYSMGMNAGYLIRSEKYIGGYQARYPTDQTRQGLAAARELAEEKAITEGQAIGIYRLSGLNSRGFWPLVEIVEPHPR